MKVFIVTLFASLIIFLITNFLGTYVTKAEFSIIEVKLVKIQTDVEWIKRNI